MKKRGPVKQPPSTDFIGPDQPKQWCLYLLECANGSLYAGITNDLEARFAAHVSGKGAKFTRANPPRRVVTFCDFPDRAAASRAEWEVKQLPRGGKVAFVNRHAGGGVAAAGLGC